MMDCIIEREASFFFFSSIIIIVQDMAHLFFFFLTRRIYSNKVHCYPTGTDAVCIHRFSFVFDDPEGLNDMTSYYTSVLPPIDEMKDKTIQRIYITRQ